MPTISGPPHEHRSTAESFGVVAGRYDRARPRYPDELVDLVAQAGPDVLDVGTGTGIFARQLRERGCRVLGVDPDPRMAAIARGHGVAVEEGTFEAWEPAGRTFDAVAAAQVWHWVEPAAGAAKAAAVLRPGGLLALFWNHAEPPADLQARFADVYRSLIPELPYDPRAARGGNPYEPFLDRIGATLGPAFAAPRTARFDWRRDYTRDEWLDFVPTQGGLTRLPPDRLRAVLDAIGAAVDETGGAFTVAYTTSAVTAVRS